MKKIFLSICLLSGFFSLQSMETRSLSVRKTAPKSNYGRNEPRKHQHVNHRKPAHQEKHARVRLTPNEELFNAVEAGHVALARQLMRKGARLNRFQTEKLSHLGSNIENAVRAVVHQESSMHNKKPMHHSSHLNHQGSRSPRYHHNPKHAKSNRASLSAQAERELQEMMESEYNHPLAM